MNTAALDNPATMEKRRHLRLPVDIKYRLHIDNEEYKGCINNISSSGAYLATINPQLPVSRVAKQGMLEMNVEEGWISARCEIVYIGNCANRASPTGAGVAVMW